MILVRSKNGAAVAFAGIGFAVVAAASPHAQAANTRTTTASSASTVVVLGAPCPKSVPRSPTDEGGHAVTCATTASGRLWVWSAPISTTIEPSAPIPSTWSTIEPTTSGVNAEVPDPALPGLYVNRAAMEARLVDIMNGERAARGLRPLIVDPRLTRLSRWWAEHTSDPVYAGRGTAHCPPGLCSVRAAELGYPSFGEVIRAWNPFPKGDMAAERFFLDSPRHMAIITNPKVTHIGFGVFISGAPGSPQSVSVVGQVGRSR